MLASAAGLLFIISALLCNVDKESKRGNQMVLESLFHPEMRSSALGAQQPAQITSVGSDRVILTQVAKCCTAVIFCRISCLLLLFNTSLHMFLRC